MNANLLKRQNGPVYSLAILDTSVLIPLRDGREPIVSRVEAQQTPVAMSAISAAELWAGVAKFPEDSAVRTRLLQVLFSAIPVLSFTTATADCYGQTVRRIGFSRRKMLDRMIAAHALEEGLPLATLNPRDVEDIPDLHIEDWS